MIVVMKAGSPEAEIARISEELSSRGLTAEKIVGKPQSSSRFGRRNR